MLNKKVLRMEEINLRSTSGVAKFFGAVVSVLGAFIVTLYKGQQILVASSSTEFPHQLLHSQQFNWIIGGLLLAVGSFSAALNCIFQTAIVREFPEKSTIVFFYCFFSTIICGSFSLIVERNPNAWQLRHGNIELIAITYAAFFGGVFHNGVHSWCFQEKGPVYVAMFKPVGIAIAVVLGVLFLGDSLYLGRMEEMNLRSSSGVAKFLGALVSVLGAFIVTFYKGQRILMGSSSAEFPNQFLRSQQLNWIIGGLLLAVGNFSSALYCIFQTAVAREFPEKSTIVFFFCFFSTIICGSFSLIVERNPNAWKLRHGNIEWMAITYAAFFSGVFHNGVRTWCLQEKGPVYVAMFKPVGIAIAVVLGVLFLGDSLYLGSVIGAVIITLGFYTVMWGIAKEQRLAPEDGIRCFESSSERTSLLQNKPTE